MKPNQINTKQITIISMICGIIGGASQVAASKLSHNGFWVIAVYAVVMLLTFIVALTRNNTELTFRKWLVIGTFSFTIMSFVLYMYILIFANPNNGIPLLGHLWRFAAIIICSVISSAVLGLFLLKRRPASLQVS